MRLKDGFYYGVKKPLIGLTDYCIYTQMACRCWTVDIDDIEVVIQ